MEGSSGSDQRTKNNNRPSNSFRSAELLGSTAFRTSVPSTGQITLSSFSSFVAEPVNAPLESNIDPTYQAIMRKLCKKDPVTKYKSLQELIDLIKQSNVEQVKSMLLIWSKSYSVIANEADPRVREGAQMVHSLIVEICGKRMAPYLKQLLPAWIASRFDACAPASCLADKSFKSTFSTAKIKEVFIFCMPEILGYVFGNLASQFQKGANTNLTVDASNYERIITSNLRTYALCLEHVNNEIKDDTAMHKALVSSDFFWSYANRDEICIRAAWFECILALLQYAPMLLLEHKKKVIENVFNEIAHTDCSLSTRVWSCILQIQIMFEDWYKFVNLNDIVLPKLSLLLKNGGFGNASLICPHYLPFISKLEEGFFQDVSLYSIYDVFFGALKSYILSENGEKNKLNYEANCHAYFECLQFVVQKIASKEYDNYSNVYSHMLLDDHMYCIILSNITIENGFCHKIIYMKVAALIWNWTKYVETSKLYSELVRNFWNKMSNIVEDIGKNGNNNDVDRLIECIGYLHVNMRKSSSEKEKLRTIEDSEKKENHSKLIQHEINQICKSLAKKIITKISEGNVDQNTLQIKMLHELSTNQDFYNEISPNRNPQETIQLLRALLEKGEGPQVLVDSIFNLLYNSNENVKQEIVESLLKIENNIIQLCVLKRLISYPTCLEPYVRNCLTKKHVSRMIMQIAKDITLCNSSERMNILQCCFFQNAAGAILIDNETATEIIDIISQPLLRNEFTDLVIACGTFIAQIMPLIPTINISKTVRYQVFFRLFQFSLNMCSNNEVHEDMLWKIISCWENELLTGDLLSEDLMKRCTHLIFEKLSDIQFNFENIDMIIIITLRLLSVTVTIQSVEEKEKHHTNSFIELLFDHDVSKIIEKLENFCTYLECLRGFNTPNNIIDSQFPSEQGLKTSFSIYFFFIKLLSCDIEASHDSDRGHVFENFDKQKLEKHIYYAHTKSVLLSYWSENIFQHLINSMNLFSLGLRLIDWDGLVEDKEKKLILEAKMIINNIIIGTSDENRVCLEKLIFKNVFHNDGMWSKLLLYLVEIDPYKESSNVYLSINAKGGRDGSIINELWHMHIIQALLPILPPGTIPLKTENLATHIDISVRVMILRAYIRNYHFTDSNLNSQKSSIEQMCRSLLSEIAEIHKSNSEYLLYNVDICKASGEKILAIAEIINLISDIIEKFPLELTVTNWDFLRIAMSSWILTVAKAVNRWTSPHIQIMIAAVFKMHASIFRFFFTEKKKSSTKMLGDVIEEWENLFAVETSLVLFKTFNTLLSNAGVSIQFWTFYDTVLPYMEFLNYDIVLNACRKEFPVKLEEFVTLLLYLFTSRKHNIRISSVAIFRQLLDGLIKLDYEKLEICSSKMQYDEKEGWHIFSCIGTLLKQYENSLDTYIKDFSYKLNAVTNIPCIDRDRMMGFFFLWESAILAASKAPEELRSYYARWISNNSMDKRLMPFLIRSMPIELLKNFDSKIIKINIFQKLEWMDIKDNNLPTQNIACHLYAQMLRFFPAVVRKWWTELNSKEKAFIDKLTTNYVSNIIIIEELQAITSEKDKLDNMTITVHTSTRDVIAKYNIDEAKMELVISLASNHPLSVAKIESEKQIGGRLQSRAVIRQLTLFLTHQNGSILDVLSLWKRNLDKKFQGVEECYVCYSVIHQDTCQLPKLTCRTCRKKFHAPCLYKWFTTSSKSTCPICRNVF